MPTFLLSCASQFSILPMSITIRRVYDSAEASTFADITLASSVSNAYINALYPDGVTSHILSNTIERLTKAIEAPNSICILAETDEEPKKPIGTAIWYTHDEPYEGLSEPVLQNVDGQRNELHLDFQRKSWEGHQSLLIGKRVISKLLLSWKVREIWLTSLLIRTLQHVCLAPVSSTGHRQQASARMYADGRRERSAHLPARYTSRQAFLREAGL